MEKWRFQFKSTTDDIHIFGKIFSKSNENIYSELVSQLVVRLISAITNNISIPDSEHNLEIIF